MNSGVRFSLPFRAILGKDFKKRHHKTILQTMVLMRRVVGVGQLEAAQTVTPQNFVRAQSRRQLHEPSSIVMVT